MALNVNTSNLLITMQVLADAAGGLGGFFPPLVMGATYDAAHRNYFIGLTLLAVTAAVAFASAFLVKHGGKPEHHKADAAAK